MTQQINADGLALIKSFESFEPTWYNDPVGIPTIGYGHTGPLPRGFHDVMTEGEASRLLAYDVQRFEAAVREAVKVPLTSNQFSALVSFAFNVGEGAFRRSTLLRKLNAGDYGAAAAEFGRWVYAGGKKFRGLVRRRAAERELFERSARRTPSIAEARPAPLARLPLPARLRSFLARLSYA